MSEREVGSVGQEVLRHRERSREVSGVSNMFGESSRSRNFIDFAFLTSDGGLTWWPLALAAAGISVLGGLFALRANARLEGRQKPEPESSTRFQKDADSNPPRS